MKNRSQDDNVGEKFTSSKVVENDTSSNVVENDTSDVENNDTSSEVIENITSSILRSCVELIPSSGPITVHGSLTVVSEGLTYLMLIHKTLQTHSTGRFTHALFRNWMPKNGSCKIFWHLIFQ